MSIFSDIKDSTGGASKSKDWYRAQLVDKLEPFSGILAVGDIIFYRYTAQTELLPFFDTYPMTLVSDVDFKKRQFSGGNLHYLRPSVRQGVASSWSSGTQAYPKRCHHKYFMSSATNMYIVPKEELANFTPLPVEQFVRDVMGRYVEIPSSFIWSRL